MTNVIPIAPHRALVPVSCVQNMPSLVKDYVFLHAPHSEVPEQIHAWVFITLLGASLGRTVWLEYPHRVFSNLYMLILGPTGAMKKDTALGFALSFFPDLHRIMSIPTAEGLMRQLKQNPHSLAYLPEASSLLRRTRMQSGETLVPLLCELFDSKSRVEHLTRGDPIIVEEPFLTMLLTTTPERLYDELHPEHLDSGFVNRLLFATSTERKCIPFPTRPRQKDMSRLKDKIHFILDFWRKAPGPVTLHPDARKLWGPHYSDLWSMQAALPIEAVQAVQRVPLHTMKLAMLFTAMDCTTVVSADNLRRAIHVMRDLAPNYEKIVGQLAQGRDLKIQKRILGVLAGGATLTRAQIQSKLGGHYSAVDFKRVFTALEWSKAVIKDGDKYRIL